MNLQEAIERKQRYDRGETPGIIGLEYVQDKPAYIAELSRKYSNTPIYTIEEATEYQRSLHVGNGIWCHVCPHCEPGAHTLHYGPPTMAYLQRHEWEHHGISPAPILPPAPKIQVTKDGPAYLLPGIEPAGQEKGDTEQLAMF